ncbi:MAG: ribonuclease H-like domain-containing protein [Planctomycetia bacterium]|nr:ribonuclease H-like domain-containing protein [Planctomycetia bacterium]
MLTNTFCGMGGIGPEAERRLWANGILTWNDYRREGRSCFSPGKHSQILRDLDEAEDHLRLGTRGLNWFLDKLPVSHHCRLHPHILDCCLYLDIETTGLEKNSIITLLTVSNGKERQTFIKDRDFEDCREILRSAKIFITFNGRSFDIPRLRRVVNLPLYQPNIDLRYVFKGWGLTGGQKKIEKILGIGRPGETASFLGADAIQLWNEYQNGTDNALNLLIQYNQNDVIGLEKLFLLLYNESMKGFPWSGKSYTFSFA